MEKTEAVQKLKEASAKFDKEIIRLRSEYENAIDKIISDIRDKKIEELRKTLRM